MIDRRSTQIEASSAAAKNRQSKDSMKAGGKSSSPRVSYTETAYQEIRRRILDNEMPAGFQITEQDVAKLLNMSRTPTREALLRLAQEGLIEIWPRHGMKVRYISVNDLREIYEILTALEAAAVGLAARHGVTDEKVAQMRANIAEMDEALKRDDLKAWAASDLKFHRLLAEASGNERLVEAVDIYHGQAHRLRMMTLRMRPKPLMSNRDHEAVVEAIANRDDEAAERIHREHRERSGKMLIDLLVEHQITSL